MKNYGDVTKINGAEVPKVNVITFGAPCQDLSIAGKRAGMKNVIMGDKETTRSGLFFEAIRIIKEMREDDKRNGRTDVNIRPRFAVYENVPGAFSSNKGEDFRAVLEETAKVAERDASIPGFEGKWPSAGCIMGNGWSIAWRVHDAQFWGVPQRRKRIALVADFGGETAPEILFERKGLSGDIAQGGKAGEGTSGNAERCTRETGAEPIILESNQNHATIQTNGISTALPASAGMGGGYVPMVAYPEKTTGSLCASGYDKLGTQEALNDMYVVESSAWDGSQVSPTLTANNANGAQRMPDKENFNAVLSYGLDRASFNQDMNAQYDFAVDEEKIGTQVAKGPGAVCENGGIYARTQNQVLRLLSETYGAQEVEKWGIAILATLQSSEILQSGMYESSVSSETKNGYKLDGSSLPCSSVVAGWLLRDMRQREECGCSSQGRKPTEQRFEQSDESMPELSQQNPQACKDLFDMWKKGEGIRLLQQALYQIQKIRRSVDVPGVIVRRLTPLEAERLQGFPDHWTDIGDWVDSKGKKTQGRFRFSQV